MLPNQARWLWTELIWDKGEKRTPLGIAALTYGVLGTNAQDDIYRAADFLDAWAKALRESAQWPL